MHDPMRYDNKNPFCDCAKARLRRENNDRYWELARKAENGALTQKELDEQSSLRHWLRVNGGFNYPK